MPIAKSVAKVVVSIDSVKNCVINCFFAEPNTLRMPTSLLRFVAVAVARFIKLTQAIKSINNAIALKI